MLQQGHYTYQNEDDSRVHIGEKLRDIQQYFFDVKVPAEKRLADFKADVINRGIKAHKKDSAGDAFQQSTRRNFERMQKESDQRHGRTASAMSRKSGGSSAGASQQIPSQLSTISGDPYVKKQAQLQYKTVPRNRRDPLQSDEAKALDIVMREVGILSNQLSMTLVNTRQKLQPFIDCCYVHEDRKKKSKTNYGHLMKVVEEKRIDGGLDNVAKEYKKQIRTHM